MSKWIDEEKVSFDCRHTSNHAVKYCVYYDKRKRVYIPEDPTIEFRAKMHSGVCFSGLVPLIKRQKVAPNRLYAVIKDDKKNAIQLSLNEKEAWVNMAIRNKMLPPYFSLEAARTGIFVLDISDIPPSLVYCYFATFRFIREDPGFVRAMVYMVDELEINFYAAFVLATRVCLTQRGHSITSGVRPYMDKAKDVERVSIRLSEIVGLRRFVRNPKKYDQRPLKTASCGYGSDYYCNSTIARAAEGIKHSCTAKFFKAPSFLKALKASSDKKVTEYITKVAEEVGNNG